MTQQTRSALKQLQRLDMRIAETKQRIRDFDPVLEEVEEPAILLESEVTTTRKRLQEMKLEERRLELASEEKRGRVTRLEDRLGSVRNLREEAAVSAELEMVRRALQSDEQEAYTLIDQVRKMSDRLVELEEGWELARAQVEPRKEELLAEREAVKGELAGLEADREAFSATLDPVELRMYNGIRAGGRRIAVAELTEDGACGHCFGMVPLQGQNEVRHGSALIRCEACGVILAAPDPESATDAEEPEIASAAAEADEGDGGGPEVASDAAEADEGDADGPPVASDAADAAETIAAASTDDGDVAADAAADVPPPLPAAAATAEPDEPVAPAGPEATTEATDEEVVEEG